jgi:methylsterol monooxygenase/4-alpha-methyl-delta7-sterol-4alpha-methyl oxidase
MIDTLQHLAQPWLAIYNEPRFWLIPMATQGIALIAFLAFALPWTYLAWKDPQWARRYRIQNKPFNVEKTFWPSLRATLVNNLILIPFLLISWPLLRLSGIHFGELPAWYVIVAQIVFFILLDDFLYYWMHRAMHKGWLLRHVHCVHHRIRNTSALDGNYFHWIEFVMTASLALVGPVLLGVHGYVLWLWIIVRQLEAADGHCGYDIPWNPTHWLPVYKGPVYHDFHHARFRGNYAGFLPYLDRFWGTYVPEYLRYIGKNKRAESEVGRVAPRPE